jgi:hypothetical protein
VWNIKKLIKQHGYYTGAPWAGGHSKMCSFVKQNNATELSSFEGGVQMALLTAGMTTRAVANFSTISCLQPCCREFGSTPNWPHNYRPRVTTPAQDHHIWLLLLWA